MLSRLCVFRPVRMFWKTISDLSLNTNQFRYFLKPHIKLICKQLCRPIKYERELAKHFSSSLTKNKLLVEPESCLHDETTHIKAIDLKPGSQVTITALIKDIRGHNFFSYAYYTANDSGVVDLKEAASHGGTYTGTFPMGPIACLRPAFNEHKYLRFFKRDVNIPSLMNFQLLSGHVENSVAFKPESSIILDTATHKRIYMAPGVERILVKQGKIRGTLFLPAGEGPFPGVIDLYGTAGGLIEGRSAQLASRGIASLALAYFDYEDLPKNMDVCDIAYFEEAARFLLNNVKVKKPVIGAIGISKGADIACALGTFLPMVKAVVCVNGLPVNTWCPLHLKDKTIPGLKFELSRAKILNPQLICSSEMMNDSEDFPDTFLPLHESDAQFLFLVSKDDKNWNTELETDRAVQRMKDKGNNNWKVLKYEGAGHLLEPPYSPFCEASYHRIAGAALLWGGNHFDHCAAQVGSWQEIINFFKTNLT